MPNLTSAEVLERMWLRFVKHNERQFGVKLSMRSFSLDVLNHKSPAEAAVRPGRDAQALSRWTNPGDRENYRIPLSRIAEVCQKLEASDEDRDALMMARMWELSLVNPQHDALVVGSWVAELYGRTQVTSPDEKAVLEAFGAASEYYDQRILDTPAEQARLKQALVDFMAPRWTEFWEERASERAQDKASTPEDREQSEERQQALLQKMGARRAVVERELAAKHKKTRKQVPHQVTAKRLLKELRLRTGKSS